MEIILRNGEKVTLDWNPLVLEYLEEYEGGMEQLKKDIDNKDCRFYTFNHILYSVISAVYPKELSYREAVSLVNINDLERIVVFVVNNVNDMNKNNNENKNINNANEFPQMYNQRHHRR